MLLPGAAGLNTDLVVLDFGFAAPFVETVYLPKLKTRGAGLSPLLQLVCGQGNQSPGTRWHGQLLQPGSATQGQWEPPNLQQGKEEVISSVQWPGVRGRPRDGCSGGLQRRLHSVAAPPRTLLPVGTCGLHPALVSLGHPGTCAPNWPLSGVALRPLRLPQAAAGASIATLPLPTLLWKQLHVAVRPSLPSSWPVCRARCAALRQGSAAETLLPGLPLAHLRSDVQAPGQGLVAPISRVCPQNRVWWPKSAGSVPSRSQVHVDFSLLST